MVKVLNRKGIQRMVGRVAGSVGSGGSSGGGGGISLAQVDAAYVSKAFFDQLFTVHGKRTYTDPETQEEVTEDVIISPNQIAEGEYSLSNVEVSVGLWTNSFLSALGLNSGGGGGGATALSELVDVALSNPQNGQVLMYNSSTGKWYNGTVQSGGGGTVTSITAGTGLTGGTITSSGTIALSQEMQTSIANGATAYGWGDHAQAGYATQQWVNNQEFLTSASLSGYATQQWVNNQGFLTGISSSMVTNALGYTPMSNDVTFWGQSVSNGSVNGIMTFSTLAMAINYSDAWGDGTNSHPWYGYDHRYPDTGVFSTTISDFYGLTLKTSQGYLSMKDDGSVGIGTTNPSHNLHVAGGTVRIGNILLVYDSTNNALMVQKSDGTAANLYATGGVSALGMSAGVSQVDAMTFNHLSVKNSMTLNGSVSIITGSSSQILRTSNDSDCIYLLNFGTTSKETGNNYYFNQYDNVGLHGTNYNYDDSWFIDPDGCARFKRLYLDSTRYLYINGGTLYYYNGSTSRQIAFA